MSETITIPGRFSGPPGVGNGGYCCGRFASLVSGPAEVTLRKPVPLETSLAVRRENGGVRILAGEEVIAEVGRVDLAEVIPPPPVTLEQALVGASHFPFEAHPFPTCFVCGPRREHLDGLKIHAYRVPGLEVVASPWVPSPSLANAEGSMPDEMLWASLDCPTGWAGLAAEPETVFLLGRLSVRIDRSVIADRVHLLVAHATARVGRKLLSNGGLYDADGRLCAVSRATWIAVAA
jgi:hypothetical protein